MEMNLSEAVCNLQTAFYTFMDAVSQAEKAGKGCLSRDIWRDGYMILFSDEETWKKLVDFFDILGLDFTTGEPDGDEYPTWYIDFEFSDGVKEAT